jgi:hypothetical protein
MSHPIKIKPTRLSRFGELLTQTLRETWAVALFLASLTTILHHHHWFAEAEYLAVRLVQISDIPRQVFGAFQSTFGNPEITQAAQLLAAKPGDKTIMLNLTPKAFEVSYGGSLPLSRDCSSAFLQGLPKALQDFNQRTGLIPVVAIDMDLAPSFAVAANARCRERGDAPEMESILKKMADYAVVIMIATTRPTPKSTELRDAFIKQMCTRRTSSTIKGIYFADAWLNLRALEPVAFYLWDLDRGHGNSSQMSAELTVKDALPPILPSLGNALRSARHLVGIQSDLSASTDHMEILTSLCETVHQGRPLISDRLVTRSNRDASHVVDRYRRQWIDFPASQTKYATSYSLDAIGELNDLHLDSQTVLIDLETALSPDLYYSPMNLATSISGIEVHNAIAWSVPTEPPRPLRSFIFDIAFSFVFAMLCTVLPKSHSRNRYPFLTVFVRRLGPPFFALILFMVFVATVKRTPAYWVDPLFLGFGMIIHTFLTSEHLAHKPKHSKTSSHSSKAGDADTTFMGRISKLEANLLDEFDVAASKSRRRSDTFFGKLWIILVMATLCYAIGLIIMTNF